jgi:hypothetical protein
MSIHKDLQIQKARLCASLKDVEPGSNEYSDILSQLDNLNRINQGVFGFSNDTAVSALTSLLSVLLVLNHERIGILTSKAVGFIKKP